MQNSDEFQSDSGQNLSENSVKVPKGYAPVIHRDSKELFNAGESWGKIPYTMFNLKKYIKASPTEQLVALSMFGYSINQGDYPTFSVGLAELASKTGLSERAISNAVRFLTASRVLFVRSSMGRSNQYTWNEQFILTPELASVVPLKEVQSHHCNTFSATTEPRSDIYIELSLEFFRTILEGYFNQNDAAYKPFTFYIPGKRKPRSVERTMRSGTTRTQHRWEAWEEAVWKIWKEIQGERGALTRLFFALAAKNVEGVQFPYAALRYRVNDSFTQNEARSRSHLNLYCDDDVKEFLDSKYRGKGNQ